VDQYSDAFVIVGWVGRHEAEALSRPHSIRWREAASRHEPPRTVRESSGGDGPVVRASGNNPGRNTHPDAFGGCGDYRSCRTVPRIVGSY
jgi:hypothetical protein